MRNATTLIQYEWLERLNDELRFYMQTLEMSGHTGRFLPCVDGGTRIGREMALGFSCFALKVYYMLGLWETLEPHKRLAWIAFLQSFQVKGNHPVPGGWVSRNAFIDPPEVEYLTARLSFPRRLIKHAFRPNHLTYPQKVIIAETKQAIATLAQVGESAERSYCGFPLTPAGVRNHLLRLDWTRPWGAGGQASALAVFLKIEAPRLLDHTKVQRLRHDFIQVIESLTDVETGGYFKRDVPQHGQLINGAMKILTALDWLEVPIHYPEKLIDTCLERLPSSDGCHLVDAVYVLYRCLQQTNHNRAKIKTYCSQVLDMILHHHNPDGGFSYNIGRSQTYYYGVPISQGLAESDIHGTCLLFWAVAMVLEILDSNQVGWQVIKP